MVLESARLAASQMLEPGMRSVLWKSLGLAVLLLVVGWIALEAVVSTFLSPFLGPWPWLSTALVWMMGAGMAAGAVFLIAPVTAALAGVFQDEIADEVERVHYPRDEPGRALPLLPSLLMSAKFLAIVALANFFALLLVLLPGINFGVFFLVNAWLLGREFFEFSAMRHMGEADAKRLRRANRMTIFLAGLVIAGFMAVPVLNLATSVFATAMMVHLRRAIQVQAIRAA
jgi:CysZ protein